MPLYHYTLGFPAWYKAPKGRIQLKYGNHAKEDSELHSIDLPNPLDLDTFFPVEIEVIADSLRKTVYRGPLDEYRDLCLVVDSDHFVRTVWINLKVDKHATLRKGKYERP